MIDQQLIEEVTRTIVARFHPRRIILFGSHARGDAGPDSDLDLFIEMETPQPPLRRGIDVSRAFPDRTWPLDVIVYTPEEVRRLKKVWGSFLTLIESEGRLLYERS